MRAIFRLSVYGLIALSAVGCGNSGLIKAKGHVVKGGQPFVAGEGLRIFFDPVNILQGTTRYDSFAAEYHADDGTFEVQRKNGQGLPPGRAATRANLRQDLHESADLDLFRAGGGRWNRGRPVRSQALPGQYDVPAGSDRG